MLDLVIDRRRRSIGALEVGRVLPFARRRMVGPFLYLDHLGPLELPRGIPRTADVLPHPHIGLAAVTYLFAGELVHRDSVGSEQAIRPGAVNWMTAGRGITHSERLERARAEGGPLHGLQAWVALPEADEEADPSFAHHDAEELPILTDGAAVIRLVAGRAWGVTAPVRGSSPLFYAHAALSAGTRVELPDDAPERAAYVVSGRVQVDGTLHDPGQLLVFGPGPAAIRAEEGSSVMLLGGEPVGPRFIEWNFVSSRRERIEQAKADWQAGRLRLPDLDPDESVPLPARWGGDPVGR